VLDRVPHFFVWSEESYGPYLWPRAAFLFPHVLGGLVAIVLGPFQFYLRIRTRYPRVHRITGRLYLAAVSLSALVGMALALTSSVNFAYASGLFGLATAWLATSGMALVSIRKRNFIQHKQWMIRSYVVTFAFVSFRLITDALMYLNIGEWSGNGAMMAWGCWAVPLLVTELVIQGRQVFAPKAI
jgi:uncharacterized membrane protein